MGFLKKLIGGADGVRESMHDSYTKHFNAAMSAGSEGNNSPHYCGLYGALGTRYLARNHSVSEMELYLELTPFLMMSEEDAIEALAEYALYQESPKDADVPQLEALINTAFQSCGIEQKSQMAVAASKTPAWVKFLNEETSEMVGKILSPSEKVTRDERMSNAPTQEDIKEALDKAKREVFNERLRPYFVNYINISSPFFLIFHQKNRSKP